MSCPTSSLVPVASWQAKQAAENLRAHILRNRALIREDSITSVLKSRTVRTGWFRNRAVTREEAIDIVDNEECEYGFMSFDAHRISGEHWINLADRLIAAFDLSESGTIYLSIEDAKTVSDYLVAKEGA